MQLIPRIRPQFPHCSDTLLLIAFLNSGLVALALELIWVRILGLAFGTESLGMLGVVAGFFAGLCLGAAVLHRTVLRSRRPVLIYVAAESTIAAYAFTALTSCPVCRKSCHTSSVRLWVTTDHWLLSRLT